MKLEETQDERGTVISLAGEADLAAVPLFQEKMRELAKNGTSPVVIDFSGVTFVNTPIWAVLVDYYQKASQSDAKFALAGLDGRVEASFEIVRLGHFISAHPTVDEAFAAL